MAALATPASYVAGGKVGMRSSEFGCPVELDEVVTQ